MSPPPAVLSTEAAIRRACLLEATARKPGNVHPGAAFHDASYEQFLRSAHVVAPILAQSGSIGIGRAIRDAVRANLDEVGCNTNLGIILLIGPLAAVPAGTTLTGGIEPVLESLTVDDAILVYEAICAAAPGGLGNVQDLDVRLRPTENLRECMRLAKDRDLIAAEYSDGYPIVLEDLLPQLAAAVDYANSWEDIVVGLQLKSMSRWPDTLITRKCGPDIARTSAHMARGVLDSGWPESAESRTMLRQFDEWLRADGHRRNPGTTADLIAASLFAALRDQVIKETPDEDELMLHAVVRGFRG